MVPVRIAVIVEGAMIFASLFAHATGLVRRRRGTMGRDPNPWSFEPRLLGPLAFVAILGVALGWLLERPPAVDLATSVWFGVVLPTLAGASLGRLLWPHHTYSPRRLDARVWLLASLSFTGGLLTGMTPHLL